MNKNNSVIYGSRLIIVLLLALSINLFAGNNKDLKVLIVSGGHGLVPQSFFEMFNSYEHISYELISHPLANMFFNNEFTDTYDAFIFWDIGREITDAQKQDFINMLGDGKGCVFLHHSIMSYQNWDKYEIIVGGRYLHKPIIKDGKEIFPALAWELNQTLSVKIEDSTHPIVSGISDFIVQDETYKNLILNDSVHVLLTTDNPKNGNAVAWTNKYGKSRIVYQQLGHGTTVFEDLNYIRFLKQAIYWVCDN